tara:strand:+ start:223 stop:357 length:135 start_codon:yes stop_codon:yes gene_type:complete
MWKEELEIGKANESFTSTSIQLLGAIMLIYRLEDQLATWLKSGS